MKSIKKYLFAIFLLIPMTAGAVSPFIIGTLGGLGAGAAGIIGVSIWRSNVPVDMVGAMNFFSSCWTCQIFSDIMITLSNILPGLYKSLGLIIMPVSIALLAMFIVWNLASGYLNGKIDNATKIVGNFSSYLTRWVLLIGLLTIPLPRMITDVLIEPAVTLGTSFDTIISDNNTFNTCMVASAMGDPVSVSAGAANYGAFSPKLRHKLACEIANVHQITGLGMTIGWTMLNMAFDTDYTHKVLSDISIFPNIPLFFSGLLILAIYFIALLPIPLYFLEIFVKLSLDLVMLPLMLMSWMFDDENFALFPKGGPTIRTMINDCIKSIVGIAITVVFLTFSVMFLNAAFGEWGGANSLYQAIMANDSKILMDGLVFQNDSIVTVVLMGIFIAMFMVMIPQLTSMLFNIKISDKYYNTAKKDIDGMWKNLKKWASQIKK